MEFALFVFRFLLLLGPGLRLVVVFCCCCCCFFVFFSRCRKSALLRRWLVASRQSWDVDWSQIGTFDMLIVRGLCANHFYSARSCKYEVPRSEMCVSGLCHLFSVPLILLTNSYSGCGRPTLNFVEQFWFWLGSVRSASQITQRNSKGLISEQMNSQVNCIALYKCPQLYSENESQKLDNLKSEPERWELDRDITPCHEEQQHSMSSSCQGVLHSLSLYHFIRYK